MINEQFTPEPPYNLDYTNGRIDNRIDINRRYVQLTNPTTKAAFITTYARYLFQVDHWKKGLGWIPQFYEVDHVNDDSMDDRLDNYQLLSKVANIKKRDIAVYRDIYVPPDLISSIGYLLQDGCSYRFIREKLDILPGHLRYLIGLYYPKHMLDNEVAFQNNKEDIKSLLQKGASQSLIADLYGVCQVTISRHITKYIPDYRRNGTLERNLNQIRMLLSEGKTLTQIATDMNCTVSNIIYYIKRYLPAQHKSMKQAKEREHVALVNSIKKLCEVGHSQRKIAEMLQVSISTVCDVVGKHFPEYRSATAYELRVNRVGELLKDGKSREEIAQILDIQRGVISSIITRFYPDHRQDETFMQKIVMLKSLLASNTPYTFEQLAQMVGIGYTTVSHYINTYFPQYSGAGRYGDINPEIRRLHAEEHLSGTKIAEKLNVSRNYVRTVLERRSLADKNDPHCELVSQIKAYLDQKYTYVKIAQILNLKPSRIATLVARHLSEYHRSATLLTEKMKD